MEIIKSNDGTIRVEFEEGFVSVIIPSKNGKKSICVSSQIGCSMGCEICYTKRFKRNLELYEILYQIEICNKIIQKMVCDSSYSKKNDKISISSVVFMGMGEPMLNWDNVLEAIRKINRDYGIAYRKITVSTVGVNLDKLLEYFRDKDNKMFNVAISLHGASDDVRNSLVNSRVNIKKIVHFCQIYDSILKKRMKNITQWMKKGIMMEYAMIRGVNDRIEDMEMLVSKKWPRNTNFNLIEFNSVGEFKNSEFEKMVFFKKKIIEYGYKCFIRESRGKDIKSACGMIEYEEKV